MNRLKLFVFVLIILLILCLFPLEVHSKEQLAMVPQAGKAGLSYSQKCLYNARENMKELRNIEERQIIDESTFATYFQVMNETISSLIEASIYAPNVRSDLLRAAEKISDYEFGLLISNPDLEPSTVRSVAVNLAYCKDLLNDINKRELLYSLARNPALLRTGSFASGKDSLSLDFFSRNETLFSGICTASKSKEKQNSKKLVSGMKFISFEDTIAAGERYYRELVQLEKLQNQGN